MESWLSTNWYVLWGVGGALIIVGYRVLRSKRSESLPRRTWYGFFPAARPGSADEKLMPLRFLLVGIGLLAIVVMYAVVWLVTGFG